MVTSTHREPAELTLSGRETFRGHPQCRSLLGRGSHRVNSTSFDNDVRVTKERWRTIPNQVTASWSGRIIVSRRALFVKELAIAIVSVRDVENEENGIQMHITETALDPASAVA